MANNELDPIVQAFIYETEVMLEQMEQILLKCEETKAFDDEDVNEIFRIMHTIKGGAGMMLFNKLAELAHSMEDMFYFIREDAPNIEDISVVSDVVLEGIDFMKEYIEGMKNDDYENLDASDISENIKKIIADIKEYNNKAKEEPKKTPKKRGPKKKAIKKLEDITEINLDMDVETELYSIVIRYTDGCEMENIRAYQTIDGLKASAINISYFPDQLLEGESGPLAEIIRKKGLQIHLQTEWSCKELEELISEIAFVENFTISPLADKDYGKFDDSDESMEEVKETASVENKDIDSKIEETVEDLEDERAKKKAIKEKKQEESGTHIQEQKRINVPVEKLDLLMDLVGELVLSETMVISNPDLKGLKLDNFSKAARQHRKIIGEVQDIVMSIRMMPLSTTFTKMKRIVRDVSKKLDKEMQIELIGEETEVDKNILEQIGDPLMHLVRNSADHGIETAEERAALGKMEEPLITLEACNSGGDVIIRVADNGRGLDRDKILEKAIKNKLIDVDESTDLTDKQIFQMIFLPGFSTTEKITEFSGRGVGMDVVRNNIEGLGGTIAVDSVKDEGTVITLKIPLTLAIVSGMIIRVGKAKYTIPIMSIQESFRPSQKDIIVDTDGNEMVMVRGNCYIIRRLNKMYNVANAVENFEEGILIMIENGDDTYCIFADEIIGEQQVVVKPLPEYVKRFNSIHGIAGCTLLGDGDISLILDVANINN